MGSLTMNMASGLGDQQYTRDRDAAYVTLRKEMDVVVKAYRAESVLRRAMDIYNEGAAVAQDHFREALRKAKEDQASRAREDTEDPW
jgi:hypothetical protein